MSGQERQILEVVTSGARRLLWSEREIAKALGWDIVPLSVLERMAEEGLVTLYLRQGETTYLVEAK